MKGGKLSGGQKQRIAISRALLLMPKVLIFDEATSVFDIINEKYFKQLIVSFKGKYTIIIISHKLNVVKNANKIIFLGKGVIISKSVTHDELIEKKGKYYEMYNNEETNISGLENIIAKKIGRIYNG